MGSLILKFNIRCLQVREEALEFFFIFRLSRCSSYELKGLTNKIEKNGSITYYKQNNNCVKKKV